MTNRFLASYLYSKLFVSGLNNPFKYMDQYFKGNFAVLQYVNDSEGKVIHLKDLKNILGVSGARITKIIQSLEKKGYVVKTISKEDKRALNLTITDLGKELLSSEEAKIINNLEEVIDKIGIKDIREYLRITNKIKRTLGDVSKNA